MNENKKVFFIINKYSGTGFRESVEGRIIDYCAARHWECTIEYTQGRGHATELARTAVNQQSNFVVVAGGDGTVNEAARGLRHTNVPMAILPTGSGNGLARHLHLPISFAKALHVLDSLQPIAMDTISINEHVSVNVSGIGFDGHIASLFGKNGKRGLAGYTKLAVKEFMRFQEFASRAELDGEKTQSKNFIVAIANSSQFGNNARIAPQASVCDEWLDICLVKKVPLSHSIGFARKMFTGNLHQSRFVTIYKAKQAHLQFDKPLPYHIDGEPQEPQQYFRVSVVPRSLMVMVPANAAV